MIIDLTDQQFYRLHVKKKTGRKPNGQAVWLCECECGNSCEVTGDNLRRGHTKSCGCLNREKAAQRAYELSQKNIVHGMHGTRIYKAWCGIRQRCYEPKSVAYPQYGGRGIKVCDEWRDDFGAFRDWALANGYQDHLTIERKDTNGDYCPENCCWATMKEQQNNRRNNRRITWDGRTQTLQQWADETGINKYTLRDRLDRGWSIERSLTEAVKKK